MDGHGLVVGECLSCFVLFCSLVFSVVDNICSECVEHMFTVHRVSDTLVLLQWFGG